MACGRSALPATRYWPFRRLAGEKDSGRPANRDGCESMLPGRGYGRCNIIMGQEDDMTGVTLQRAYGHSIPVFIGGLAGDEESAPSFGHLRILPADLSEPGSGLRVDRRRALLCGPCARDGRSERRRSLVRVARPSGWDLANPYIRERMSARTLGIWVVPSGTGRCVPRAV